MYPSQTAPRRTVTEMPNHTCRTRVGQASPLLCVPTGGRGETSSLPQGNHADLSVASIIQNLRHVGIISAQEMEINKGLTRCLQLVSDSVGVILSGSKEML